MDDEFHKRVLSPAWSILDAFLPSLLIVEQERRPALALCARERAEIAIYTMYYGIRHEMSS